MTMYDTKAREQMAAQLEGDVIEKLDYCEPEDYYTITLQSGPEFSFRWMADLVQEASASQALLKECEDLLHGLSTSEVSGYWKDETTWVDSAVLLPRVRAHLGDQA